jgi:hypothetical protein
MDGLSVRPHNEIQQNLLTSKTGYVKIASRLGFGINLAFTITIFSHHPYKHFIISIEFLGVSKRLYKRLCPSVGPSVRRQVGASPYCFAPGELAPGLSFALVYEL